MQQSCLICAVFTILERLCGNPWHELWSVLKMNWFATNWSFSSKVKVFLCNTELWSWRWRCGGSGRVVLVGRKPPLNIQPFTQQCLMHNLCALRKAFPDILICSGDLCCISMGTWLRGDRQVLEQSCSWCSTRCLELSRLCLAGRVVRILSR